jgi:hypothetical protein
MAGRCAATRKTLEHGPVDQKDVEPAIRIEVERRDPGACRLEQVLVGRLTAEHGYRGQSGLACGIPEGKRRRCGLRRPSGGAELRDADDQCRDGERPVPTHRTVHGLSPGGRR